MAHAPSVNMQRVTGRDERAHAGAGTQELAPWGYGADFKLELVPEALRVVAQRIGEAKGHFHLGYGGRYRCPTRRPHQP